MKSLLSYALLPVLALGVACSSSSEEESPTPAATPTATPVPTVEVIDLTEDFIAPTETQVQWVMPEQIIPAYTELMNCFIFTYEGPDAAINQMINMQAQYGHHVTAQSVDRFPEGVYPENKVFDCTSPDSIPMDKIDLLFIAIDDQPLDEGMASLLKSGTKVMFQSHYVNPNAQPIRVQDAINVNFIPMESVTTWVAPWAHADVTFELPSNARTTITLDCTWEKDVELMFLLGHMHEWGERITVDWIKKDGTTVPYLYEYDWKPEYRDIPPIKTYKSGQLKVSAGDRFVTTCSFFNDTDHVIEFPEEMCASSGMAYPAMEALNCIFY